MVHVSITNPSADSPLPYFWGKAANEQAVIASGMSYAILRPTVLFGTEDILINNVAWILRRFPFFGQIGNGQYKLQPVYVDDLAALAVEAGSREDNFTWDAVGPDIFTFDELVRLVGESIGCPRPILHLPPRLALAAAQVISLFVLDVVLTLEEVDGLMAGLLVSSEPPRGMTRLADWLRENRDTVGVRYASELARHFK
jgi:NADH dehydrogenase